MTPIYIREATAADIDAAMDIFDKARAFMRSCGNSTQWVGGYPSREIIEADVENGSLFVGENPEGKAVAVFAFIIGEDPTYMEIDGKGWLNDRPYGTIHRLGSDGSVKGAFSACLEFCRKRISNIRLDTHAANTVMLGAARKAGFTECGIIHVADGTPRIAFQKDFHTEESL